MKKLGLLTAVFTLALMLYSVPAMAAPVLPNGPVYIKFDNREQISTSGTMMNWSGTAAEMNWGIFEVSTLAAGDTTNDPQNFDPVSPPFWAGLDGGEITGMWAGVQHNLADPAAGLNGMGGSMYFYYDDTPDAQLGSATPGQRTGDFTFTNFTDGVLLAKIDFLPGGITGDPLTTLTGTSVPTGTGFSGIADSFATIDMAAGGLWAERLDSNYFNTLLGNNTADMRLKTSYWGGPAHSWNGTDAQGNPIFGATSADPALAYVVPEPSTIVLLGMGLLGAGFVARRRNKKKS